LILPKKTKQPTCEDALAVLVKQPVNKKKRTKRIECEQAESSHANEQLQIVRRDPLANQHNKPDKKKRKIPPKVDRQNRLNLPLKQLLTEDFLSDEERWILESDGEIMVRLVGLNLKMFKEPMELKIWDMTRTIVDRPPLCRTASNRIA
nr:B3 domain-containing protein, DNA-binding pseudobarrel domain protein [Tanacetum cinerariifolium]